MNRYIDSEIILNRKINNFVYVYIMIIIIITLSLIIFFILFNYKTHYKVKGIVIKEDNLYYIKSYIPIDKVKHIINNSIVRIDNKNYKYKIHTINEEYLTDNNTTYEVVNLDIEITEKYIINNLVIDLYFIKEDKRIIDYIIRKE